MNPDPHSIAPADPVEVGSRSPGALRRVLRLRLTRGTAGVLLMTGLAVLATLGAGERRPTNDPFEPQRRAMVEQQVARRGVGEKAVLQAMREVPRHLFVPSNLVSWSYADRPLPIGYEQTISQPYIVARMTELLKLDKSSKVLEIGTGSGYHAAVLSRVAGEVYSIEIIESLGKRAQQTLTRLGYDNVTVRVGDGYRGWPEKAPFDAILLTAAPPEIPQPLIDQLKVGGRMVLPQGSGNVQELYRVTKLENSLERERIAAVRFVPMTGEVRQER